MCWMKEEGSSQAINVKCVNGDKDGIGDGQELLAKCNDVLTPIIKTRIPFLVEGCIRGIIR